LEDLSGTPAPEPISELESLPILHGRVCEPGEMAEVVAEIL